MDIKKMTLSQLEQEHKNNKLATQKLVERELRQFYIGSEIMRRLKNNPH